MDLRELLSRHRFPDNVIDLYLKSGVTSLFPPQEEALSRGVLEGKNILLSVPTAAGKTLIAELAMLRAVLHSGGRCLYIAPLKALVSEKYEDFKKRFAPLGVKVGMATGDMDTQEKGAARSQVLVATAEKVDSLLRSKSHGLIPSLSVLVLDEIHFLNDGSRGPVLEILAARVKQLNPSVQIIALSATVNNAEEMAGWLKAECVVSTWRPIPLKEGVYYNKRITFHQHPIRMVEEDSDQDLNGLVTDTIRGDGQVLVFVNSRRSAQAAAREISSDVGQLLLPAEKEKLAALAKQVAGSASESTKVCRKLGDVVKHGVAFHHAGLKPKQRKLIEDNFKGNLIKAICSTPTLAAGVNLPARRSVVRDVKRFEDGLGSSFIPVSEYKQCAGRAGRPQFDEYGEAVLIAKSQSEAKMLMDRYIRSEPEPVTSQLGNESALRIHILASIAGGYVHDVNDMLDFLSHTFLAHQRLVPNLLEMVSAVFTFLEREGFIEKQGFRFFATTFGQCTSRLYIDPASSIVLRDGLKKLGGGKSFSSVGLLQLITCCPDSPLLRVSKNDFEDLERFSAGCQDELVFEQGELPILDDVFGYLSVLKTTWLLCRWVQEDREEPICDEMNIGPGDVYRHCEAARWLLHCAVVFAELFELKKLTFPLENLRVRVQYGILEELMDLCTLKGIGRVRARALFENGYRKLADLKKADLDDLAKLPHIGPALAQEILDQVSGRPSASALAAYIEERMNDL